MRHIECSHDLNNVALSYPLRVPRKLLGPACLTLAKTFTQDYRISTILVQDTSTSTVVLNRSYAFGDAINITGITDSLNSARSESYVYTASNRLQEGDGIWGTLTWR